MANLQIKNYKQASVQEWVPMAGSEAIGLPLIKSGNFAADMLNFEPGQQTSLHIHPGDHILFVVEGDGWLKYGARTIELTRGTCYFVPGAVPHRVKAASIGLTLLSVANQHQPVNSPNRLEVLCE